MRKRDGVYAIVMIFCMLLALLPVAAQGRAEKKEQMTIGVVIPYQLGW